MKTMVFAFLSLALASAFGAGSPLRETVKLWPEGMTPPNAAPNQKYAPTLDWYTPTNKTCDACVMFVSGGAYNSCCDGKAIEPLVKRLNARGMVCASITYRTPRPQGLPMHLPAWTDGQRAVRIIRADAAKRGLNPEKIAVLGYSAGSHLCALLATSSQTPAYAPVDELDKTPCHVNLAALVYPAYVLSDGLTDVNERKGVGDDVTLSPLLKFDSRTPPMSFYHGGSDMYSPIGSVKIYHRLRTMKIPAEMHLYADGPHGFFYGGKRYGGDKDDGGKHYGDRFEEWLVQMGWFGPVPKEVDYRARRDLSHTREREIQDLWPKGCVPNVQTNQTLKPVLEWYHPRELATKSVQIIVPGGGYNGASRGEDDGETVPIATAFNRRGMTAVVVHYRTPRPLNLSKHESARQDVQRAIRLVRFEAKKRGLDPEKIGIMGFSAGGHAVLMAATTSQLRAYRSASDAVERESCRPNWAIPVYPAYVLSDGLDGPNATRGNAPGLYITDDFSFDLDTPPMCFFHGDADDYSPMGSVRTWERLRRMGIQCDLHVFAKRKHCFQFRASPGTGSYNWMDMVFQWFTHIDALKPSPALLRAKP